MKRLQDALTDTSLPLEEIARRTQARWSALDPKGADVEPRSLAAKIGQLRSGKGASYFRKRQTAYQALCQVLGVPASASEQAQLYPDRAFEFSRCPEMQPLLAGEAPCSTSKDGSWLGSVVLEKLRRGQKTWIVVPPGSGKRLACFTIRHARTDVHVVEVRSLAELDLAAARDDQHLLVRVDTPAHDRLAAHRALLGRDHASVCVLASFEPPRELDPLGWDVEDNVLVPTWRASFVAWSAKRLPAGTKLRAAALVDWLENTDPRCELYPTPGDLMLLVERAHRLGVPSVTNNPAHLVMDTMRRVFGKHLDPHFHTRGADIVRDMLRARFLDVADPVGPRTSESWAQYALQGRLSDDDPKKARASSRVRGGSGKITGTPDPAGVVEALRLEGILRVERSGELEFAPWVRVALERDVVTSAIQQGEASWAAWSCDVSRARQVEAVLGSRTLAELLATFAAQSANAPDGVSRAALVETTFVAVARLLDTKSPSRSDEDTKRIQALGVEQLHLVRRLGASGCLGPVVLPCASESARKEWFNLAWRFSFIVVAPKALDVDPGLVFPGWSKSLRPGQDTRVLELLWALEPPMRDMHHVLRRFADLEMPMLMPLDLLVAFALDGDQRARLQPHHWQLLFASDAVETLCRRVDAASSDRAELYLAIFEAARTVFGNDIANLVRLPPALLRGWGQYVGDEAWSAFVEGIAPWSLRDSLTWIASRRPGEAPGGLVRTALRRLATHAQVEVTPNANSALASLVDQLESNDLELLVALVVDHSGFGEPAARRGWELDPEPALQAAIGVLYAGRNAASQWFHCAPESELPRLLEALEGVSGELPPWSQMWLRTRLGGARQHAPRVFDLLVRSVADASATARFETT